MATTKNDLREYVDRIAQELRNIYDGTTTDEDGERMDFYTYFENALDIEYIIGGDGTYRGAELAVALGGPNIYINTRRGEVIGYWGSDKETAWIPSEIRDEIDYIFEDYYNATR